MGLYTVGTGGHVEKYPQEVYGVFMGLWVEVV